MRPARPPHALSAVLLVAWLAGACARFEGVEGCRAFARTVNPTLTQIELVERSAAPKPADYRRVASDYQRLSEEISRLQLHGEALSMEVRQYRESMIRTAELVRQAADLLQRDRGGQLEGVRRELQSLDQRQRQQTRRIEALCRTGGRGS